jgi:hypothetical protein
VSSHTNVRRVARPEHDRAVSALLRPGNAAANDIADHAAVLDAATPGHLRLLPLLVHIGGHRLMVGRALRDSTLVRQAEQPMSWAAGERWA